MVEDKYKYIEMNLVEQNEKKKTQTYAVRNIESQLILGYIKWSRDWRQYVFETIPESSVIFVFSKGCLIDICDFISKLMYERTRQ